MKKAPAKCRGLPVLCLSCEVIAKEMVQSDPAGLIKEKIAVSRMVAETDWRWVWRQSGVGGTGLLKVNFVQNCNFVKGIEKAASHPAVCTKNEILCVFAQLTARNFKFCRTEHCPLPTFSV